LQQSVAIFCGAHEQGFYGSKQVPRNSCILREIAEVHFEINAILELLCPAVENAMQTRYVTWSNNNQQMNKFAPRWSKQTQLSQNTRVNIYTRVCG
jgi:hypothetical protein